MKQIILVKTLFLHVNSNQSTHTQSVYLTATEALNWHNILAIKSINLLIALSHKISPRLKTLVRL